MPALAPIDKNVYKSEPKFTPKNEVTKQKYFEIYQDCVMAHLTHKQLGDKYNYDQRHIQRIIKWAVYELDVTTDKNVTQRVMYDKVAIQLQQLELLLVDEAREGEDKKPLTLPEKLSVLTEIRQTVKLLAQVQGLMGTDVNVGGVPQININLPDLGRGKGVGEVVNDKQ